MLTAVWAAVIMAAAFWAVGVSVAVYVMLKAGRLMSETSAAVAGLRERGDLLIERANTAIDRAGEQVTRPETLTDSLDGVTATMTELGGRLSALAPAARTLADGLGAPLTWLAALVYGISRALGLRSTPRPGNLRGRAGSPARAARLRGTGGAARDAGRPLIEPRSRAALAGRCDGTGP
jgi:hypothetical protein